MLNLRISLPSVCSFLCLLALLISSSSVKANDYQLSSAIKPVFQAIHLKLDPDNPVFSGRTRIEIEVVEAAEVVGFYQHSLEIESAELLMGDKSTPLTVTPAKNDIQHASTGEPIQPGRYELVISFKGKVNKTSDGVYLSEFEDRNYLFTQFEDMHARKAFPSFDEPSNKIPYQMTIESPEKHTVLSNTPVQSRELNNGWQTVSFKKTKPMPTYLIAFAVGELDSAEITGLSVPGRIYTPKGQAHRTKFVVKHTPKILANLESYFGIDYPYEKLDFVAVPNFTHGAMENVGLVTYRSSLMLLEDEPRLSEQGRPLMVIAHELAHMWYGNLVTMAWWDDLWLNEAFASWMASKVMLDLYPEQNYAAQLVAERAFGMDADPTTRPIKKQVRVSVDVMDGLGLNYSKGEAILQLMEKMVGEKFFQKAVRNYMKEHRFANAKADDLWSNLSDVASFDVPAIMKTYLEQPAYPLISITKEGAVSQKRYHLAGATVDPQTWIVPLNLKYKKNGKVINETVFLKEQETNLKQLAGADWVYPNADARGYFRWRVSNDQAESLLRDLGELTGREKKSLIYNYQALLEAGEVSLSDTMAVLESLAAEDELMVARSVAATLEGFEYLVDSKNEANFGQFVNAKLGRWIDTLGLEEKKSESEDVARLRQSAFSLLAKYSNDPEILKVSQDITNAYFRDSTSASIRMAAYALRAVAKRGDAKTFDQFSKAYAATTDANARSVIHSSMSFPNDTEVIRALEFGLNEVGPADTIIVLATASANQEKHDVLYKWLSKNADEVIGKMPEFHIASMAKYVSEVCSQHNIDLAADFYKTQASKHKGMQRGYEVALSASKQCVELKDRYQSEFNSFLETAAK